MVQLQKSTIDTTQTGAPINPYIYGRFIDHPGRSIYGGIRAEMLEDRKFHNDVAAEYAPCAGLKDAAYPVVGASPWQVMVPDGGVEMMTKDIFAGKPSVFARKDSGIRQKDPGVVAGKSYPCYPWARTAGTSDVNLFVALAWTDNTCRERHVVHAGDYVKLPIDIDRQFLTLL